MIFRVMLKRAAIAAAVTAMMGSAPYYAALAQDGSDTQRQQSAKQPQKSAGAVVRAAVMNNWSIAGEPPSPALVRIRFNLHRDGSLNGNPVVETVSDDPRFPIFAASARRAILKSLPFDVEAYGDSYEDWKEVVITFDGSAMESEDVDKTQQLPTLEELAGVIYEKGPATGRQTETDIQVVENFKILGSERHGLLMEKFMADGTPVAAMALCGLDPAKGEFGLGVDFGLNVSRQGPQPVVMEIDGHRQSVEMHAMLRNLFVEGDVAKAALGKLLTSSDTLKFDGPQGASASFDLKSAGEQLARMKTLCAL